MDEQKEKQPTPPPTKPKRKKPYGKKRARDNAKRAERRQIALEALHEPYDEEEAGHEPYIKRDVRGRPTVMTKQTLRKLEDAFKVGCTDREACIYAGIAQPTLYRYIDSHPEFREQKEEWKESPVIAARAVVIGSINRQSVPDAWSYLRAKRKDEFAEKQKHEIENAISAEELAKANQLILDGEPE